MFQPKNGDIVYAKINDEWVTTIKLFYIGRKSSGLHCCEDSDGIINFVREVRVDFDVD